MHTQSYFATLEETSSNEEYDLMSDAVLHDSGPEVNQHTLIQEGEIYLYQAYDVAFQIDLVQAVKNLQQGIERPQLAKERRQPQPQSFLSASSCWAP